MNTEKHQTPAFDGMSIRAIRLFPESQFLQDEWRRAVGVVRKTSRGWLLDKPVKKGKQQ